MRGGLTIWLWKWWTWRMRAWHTRSRWLFMFCNLGLAWTQLQRLCKVIFVCFENIIMNICLVSIGHWEWVNCRLWWLLSCFMFHSCCALVKHVYKFNLLWNIRLDINISNCWSCVASNPPSFVIKSSARWLTWAVAWINCQFSTLWCIRWLCCFLSFLFASTVKVQSWSDKSQRFCFLFTFFLAQNEQVNWNNLCLLICPNRRNCWFGGFC